MSAEYTTHIESYRIQVDKIGGGTLGKAYEGAWSVTVHCGPILVFDAEEMTSAMRRTHAEAAQMAYEFATAAMAD